MHLHVLVKLVYIYHVYCQNWPPKKTFWQMYLCNVAANLSSADKNWPFVGFIAQQWTCDKQEPSRAGSDTKGAPRAIIVPLPPIQCFIPRNQSRLAWSQLGQAAVNSLLHHNIMYHPVANGYSVPNCQNLVLQLNNHDHDDTYMKSSLIWYTTLQVWCDV